MESKGAVHSVESSREMRWQIGYVGLEECCILQFTLPSNGVRGGHHLTREIDSNDFPVWNQFSQANHLSARPTREVQYSRRRRQEATDQGESFFMDGPCERQHNLFV